MMKRFFCKHHRLCIVFLNTSLLFLFSFALSSLHYETNDDATLSNIAAGAFGTNTQDMIYVNIVFSSFLKILYTLLPQLNHFVLLQLVLVFFSIAAILYLFIDKHGLFYGLAIGNLVFVTLAVELISNFQYVKTSTIIILAGLLLIAANLSRRNAAVFFGFLLTVLGCMIRFESFFAVGALTAFVLLFYFFKLPRPQRASAILQMLLFVLVFSFEGINTLYYTTSDQWAEFSRYNQARTTLSDYKENYIPHSLDALRSAGFSANDIQMLYSRNYYDNVVFPTEVIEQANAAVTEKPFSAIVADYLHSLIQLTQNLNERFPRAGLWIAILCLVTCRRKNLLYGIGTLGMFLALIFYLVSVNRYMSRLEVLLITAAAINIAFLHEPASPKSHFRKSAVLLAGCLLILACLPVQIRYQASKTNRYLTASLQYEDAVQQISADKENLYLFDPTQTDFFAGYDPFRPRSANFFNNICPTGSWYANSMYTNSVLARYGLESPLLNSVNNGQVYISNVMIEEKLQYVREHYDPNVYAVKVSDNGLCDYQFRLD